MRRKNKMLVVILMIALLIGVLPYGTKRTTSKATGYGISNPRVEKNGEVVTWDCIYFGNYWQNDTDGDGIADQNDEKEPIKWRVLSVDGDDAFLLADQDLDCQPYNQKHEEVTWESCTLRSWLNKDFYNVAFSSDEQNAIKPTDIPADIEGKYNIQDRIYLLSESELSNITYGFNYDIINNEAFYSKNTLYAISRGGKTYDDDTAGASLTRQLFDFQPSIYVIGYFGVYQYIDNSDATIRPCLHLALSSNLWKSAGIVIAERYKGTTTGTPTPVATPTPTATPVPSNLPRPTYPTAKIATHPPKKATPTATATTTPKPITAPSKPTKLSDKNNKKKSVTISWKKVKGAKGYQIQYALNKGFSTKKSKHTTKTKITIKKLKKKKAYSFRVRAYVLDGKKKIYGKWSAVKSVKIRK